MPYRKSKTRGGVLFNKNDCYNKTDINRVKFKHYEKQPVDVVHIRDKPTDKKAHCITQEELEKIVEFAIKRDATPKNPYTNNPLSPELIADTVKKLKEKGLIRQEELNVIDLTNDSHIENYRDDSESENDSESDSDSDGEDDDYDAQFRRQQRAMERSQREHRRQNRIHSRNMYLGDLATLSNPNDYARYSSSNIDDIYSSPENGRYSSSNVRGGQKKRKSSKTKTKRKSSKTKTKRKSSKTKTKRKSLRR
jgi:hypothetical protein